MYTVVTSFKEIAQVRSARRVKRMTQSDAVQLPIFSTFFYDIADNLSMKKSITDCTCLLRALLLFASTWFYIT